MERLTPNGEHSRLEADILKKNDDALATIRLIAHVSLTDQIQRATAIYDFAMNEYIEGGMVYGDQQTRMKPIPLFDSPSDREIQQGPVRINLNILPTVGEKLQHYGIRGEDTHVIDNVVNHYARMVDLVVRHIPIKVRKASGDIEDFPIL